MGNKVAKGKQLQKTTTGKGVVVSTGRLNKRTNAKQETSKRTR